MIGCVTSEAAKDEPGLTDEEVAALLPALAEAERATEATADRFVPPRPGILEEASARRHQLVYGRRGVGKSTLLRRVAAGDPAHDREVIFIDIETLRGRPYPDVLIELLQELLDHLYDRLTADGWWKTWRRRRIRKRVADLSEAMRTLLREPQSAEHTVRTLRSQTSTSRTGWSLRGSVRLSTQSHGVGATGGAGAHKSRDDQMQGAQEATAQATFERTKMEGLTEAAVLIRNVLAASQDEVKTPTLLVLDDFYHIAREDQPEVLAYLHQVVKGLDINLKVCGVRQRLQPFADGNPPVGMQPEHDAGTISLDITLEKFEVAKQFLERVLSGICEPHGIDLERMMTDGARERLVLASAGVARDYLSLVRRALRNSAERPSHQFRPKNRITAEDVNESAADLYEQKQDELKQDADEEAEALRSRLSEIVRFCLETNRTNVFLIETTKLQEETWGNQVQSLSDLRFLHRIDSVSTKRGGQTYPGRKFAAFTLDLSTWTSTRSEQISPIRFWETDGRQKIRNPNLIYTPDRAKGTDGTSAQKALEAPVLADDEQLTFDDLAES
jgi:Cdc6-like AAA superfamily ATPase